MAIPNFDEIKANIIWFFTESAFATLNAAILTALLAFVGVVGGIFPSDIKESIITLLFFGKFDFTFPFFHGFSREISVGAICFWALLLISTLYFGVRQWAVDKVESFKLDQLRELISTMPPTDIMSLYADAIEICHKLTASNTSSTIQPPVSDIIDSANAIIRWISTIAWNYDRRPRARYAANVMLYFPISHIDSSSQRIKNLLTFEVNYDFSKWKGLLYLDTELSAVNDQPGKDVALTEFVLPVPTIIRRVVGGEERFKALPGAPIATSTDTPDYYKDTWQVKDWLSTEADFTGEQEELICGYFRDSATKVRSFLSIPIQDDNGNPLAVINIHSDKVDIFRATDESVLRFVLLIKPLLEMLKAHIELINTARPLNSQLQ